jgi:tetratricopeptide (TPR) repeat protein
MLPIILSLLLSAPNPGLLAQAAECYRGQDYSAAHDLCLDYLKTDPNNLPGQFLYVATCNQLNRMDEAHNLYAKSASKGDTSAEGFLALIKLLEGDRLAANNTAREVLGKSPQCAPALFVAAITAGELPESITKTQALVAAAPDYAGGYELSAAFLQSDKKMEDAAQTMRTAYGLPTHSARAAGSLAELLLLAGHGDQAWDICNQAIKQGENDARLWSVAASILYAQKKIPQAVAMVYQACMRAAPDVRINGIMDRLLADAQPQHEHEHGADAHAGISDAIRLYSEGKLEEALAKFEKLSKTDSDDATVWLLKGMSLSDLGRTDEALTSLDKAAQIAPADPRAPLYRAEVLKKMKDYTGAYQYYSRAMLLDPREVRAHAGMASCALLAGADGPETFHALTALAMAPGNPDATSVLEMKRNYSSGVAAASRLATDKTIIAYRLMDPVECVVPRRYEIVVLDENDEWLCSYSWALLPTEQVLEVRDGVSKEHRLIPLPPDANIATVLDLIKNDLTNSPSPQK